MKKPAGLVIFRKYIQFIKLVQYTQYDIFYYNVVNTFFFLKFLKSVLTGGGGTGIVLAGAGIDVITCGGGMLTTCTGGV